VTAETPSNVRLLVVADDVRLVDYLRILLQCARPQAVRRRLTDVVMPEMSVHDLARRIQASRSDTLVLFMSGFAGHFALGDISGAPFIRKPFAADDFLAAIAEILGQRGDTASQA